MQYNYVTGNEYQGKNQAILSMAGYGSKDWATFIQWKQSGYKVNKGAKGYPIMAVCKTETEDGDETGVRYYTVFNMEQVTKVEYK